MTGPHFPGPPRRDTGPADLPPVAPEIDGLREWAHGRVGVVHVGPPRAPRTIPRWAVAIGVAVAISAAGLGLYVWRG